MASILKLHKSRGFSYRVFIRRKGLKPITKVFSKRGLAESFVERIEGDKEMLLAYGGSRNYHITFKQLAIDYLKYEYTGKDDISTSTVNLWPPSGHIRSSVVNVVATLLSEKHKTISPNVFDRKIFFTLGQLKKPQGKKQLEYNKIKSLIPILKQLSFALIVVII